MMPNSESRKRLTEPAEPNTPRERVAELADEFTSQARSAETEDRSLSGIDSILSAYWEGKADAHREDAIDLRAVLATPESAESGERCPYVATDPITTRKPREDGWRCGRDAAEPHNHTLYTAGGEHTLYAGSWKLPARSAESEPSGQTEAEAELEREAAWVVWVGAQPPYSVSYIDPQVVPGTPKDGQWFVMGTVDGDPRNQQGPVAICEYEPSAHCIAALLNANAPAAPVPVPTVGGETERCECGHFFGSHGTKGCTIELGDSGSGSVADAVFCRCRWTPPAEPARPSITEDQARQLVAHDEIPTAQRIAAPLPTELSDSRERESDEPGHSQDGVTTVGDVEALVDALARVLCGETWDGDKGAPVLADAHRRLARKAIAAGYRKVED